MQSRPGFSTPSPSPGRGRISCAGLLVLLLTACGAQSPEAPDPAHPVTRLVEVQPVRMLEQGPEIRLHGQVRAVRRARPGFLHSGELAEKSVPRGAQVQAGQRLAVLHNPALAPAVAVAEARVRELDERLLQQDAEVQRMQTLRERGVVSSDAFERALAQRNATREARGQALAALDESRLQHAEGMLTAPFDGVIVDWLLEPGDFAPAGQPVLEIAGSAREVLAHAGARLSSRLAAGQGVQVVAREGSLMLPSRIREVGLAGAHGRLAPVIIDLPADAGLTPGESVSITLFDPIGPVLAVPLTAIVDNGHGQPRVWTVIDHRAHAIPVRPGQLRGQWVEVRAGDDAGTPLHADDPVITAGHHSLLSGQAVRVRP